MTSSPTADKVLPPRSPWQIIYGTAHRLRRRWYGRRARSLPRPVISVGNLHWGGTGKTPLVAALARRLSESGRHVCILSRGYRGRGRGVRVVSTGEGPLLGPRTAGDEPVLLASQLRGVSVVVGADRHRAGRQALERLPRQPDFFLLEDGFSHLALRRDVDLLTFPASDPFAAGRLWPSGGLREPLASSRHADAAVLTGATPPAGESIAAILRPFGFRGPCFAAAARVEHARVERGDPLAAGSRVLLVTGIARPERVSKSIASLAYDVRGVLHFPDHHHYPATSLDRIARRLVETGADWVLTTAKDHVKLLGRLDAPLALLPLRLEPEPSFWSWLFSRVDALG